MKSLLDLLFIPNGRCPICYRVLFFTQDFICAHCIKKLEYIKDGTCSKCGRKIEDTHFINDREIQIRQYCTDCLTDIYSFKKGCSLFNYKGNIRHIISEIKYNNSPELGVYMGKFLGEFLLSQPWLVSMDFLVPVPLHDNRLKERGYNQAEKITKGVAEIFLDYPALSHIRMNESCLIRKANNPHQVHMNKEERFRNVRNIFQATEDQVIKNKNILLIDDVYTTGATIEACSRALLLGGAKDVYFATLASGSLN